MPAIDLSAVDTVITSRKSVRAYKKDAVSHELLRHLLEMAMHAPSTTNTQPWKVYVLTGPALDRLTDAVCAAFDTESEKHHSEYAYYPDKPLEPYLSRRRKLGHDMYRLLGIAREDRERRLEQHRRNLQFFGAPAGLIFTLHRDLTKANFIDYGAFFQTIMLSAKSHGLDTCLQAYWSDYHQVIRDVLGLASEEMVLAGMAIGYADNEATINRLVSEREPVDSFATFLDR